MEHTADWALLVRGDDLGDLLINAARGMLSLLEAFPRNHDEERRTLELAAEDPEGLLVAWLEELLYGIESRGVTYTQFTVKRLEGDHLVAEVAEVPAAGLRKHIKAVTYHNLEIVQTASGLETTIVFDV